MTDDSNTESLPPIFLAVIIFTLSGFCFFFFSVFALFIFVALVNGWSLYVELFDNGYEWNLLVLAIWALGACIFFRVAGYRLTHPQNKQEESR